MEIKWTLKEIGAHVQGRALGEVHLSFSHLATDSRTMAYAKDTLFVALVGEQHDGHDYLRELYERGVRLFLVSRLPDMDTYSGAGFFLVENTLYALQALAAARRRQFKGPVAAITGSNGKTIVKEWLYQCLSGQYSVHRSPKSYNSQVGVPLSVWMAGPDHEMAIYEAGISRPGEMARLEPIIQPGIGIFTNLGTAHQDHFETVEEKLNEKLILFGNCSKIICRSDFRVGSVPLTQFMSGLGAEIVDWSLEGNSRYRYSVNRTSSSVSEVALILPEGTYPFTLPFTDEASVENALHALTAAIEMGLPADKATRCIEGVEPVSMRLEILQGLQGCILINDAYNSDIGGLSAALDLMNQQDRQKEKVLILSDLLQSGMADADLYAGIASLVKQKGIDHFIGIGPSMMQHRSRFPGKVHFFRDTDDFLKRMDRTLFRNRTVLIKGSRKFGFERITGELQLKTHQTLLEIDLNAMVHNLNYYRSLLPQGVKTMVMVKALSYGSGNVEIANLLQFHKVDYLAVAFIDEGTELRKAGIHIPVMVLNPDPSGYAQMLDYQLEPEVYGFRGLQALYEIIHYRGILGYPVHIKLDTGMHRLGFQENELMELIPWLKKGEFRVVSVFSHLAASDEPLHDEFTRRQLRDFERITTLLSRELGISFERHVLNSAGIERFAEASFEMVRLGIGLHGIGEAKELMPASSFRTSVSQVRKVMSGETIGYSREGVAHRDSLIATIPVGYADGMNRRLGNGAGTVWINGSRVPTIGSICMDMSMIDVTGLKVSEGDQVEIFGKHQPVSLMAEQAGTIPYEILTSIPERVKRVYLQE